MELFSYLLAKNSNSGGGSAVLQEKEVSITTNGTTIVSPDPSYDGLSSVEITTNVEPNLESKQVSITTNETTIVSADEGYDGLSSVEITTNVEPNLESKQVSITTNGTTTVSAGEGYDGLSGVSINTWVSDYTGTLDEEGLLALNWSQSDIDNLKNNIQWMGKWDDYYKLNATDLTGVTNNTSRYLPKSFTISGNSGYQLDSYTNLIGIPLFDFSSVTNASYCFRNANNLMCYPSLDFSNVTNADYCFQNNYGLIKAPNFDFSKVTTGQGCFSNCYAMRIVPDIDLSSLINGDNFFGNCRGVISFGKIKSNNGTLTNMKAMFSNNLSLQTLDLSEVTTNNVTNMQELFNGCVSLKYLDIRNFNLSSVNSYSNMFGSSGLFVPASCLIIVADNTAKTWITSKFPRLTNVKTVDEL